MPMSLAPVRSSVRLRTASIVPQHVTAVLRLSSGAQPICGRFESPEAEPRDAQRAGMGQGVDEQRSRRVQVAETNFGDRDGACDLCRIPGQKSDLLQRLTKQVDSSAVVALGESHVAERRRCVDDADIVIEGSPLCECLTREGLHLSKRVNSGARDCDLCEKSGTTNAIQFACAGDRLVRALGRGGVFAEIRCDVGQDRENVRCPGGVACVFEDGERLGEQVLRPSAVAPICQLIARETGE